MPSFDWYVKRLQAMSLKEIAYRVKLHWNKRNWRQQAKSGKPAVAPRRIEASDCLDIHWARNTSEGQALLAEAESYLKHEWHFFGLRGLQEFPIDWHADPTTKKTAPKEFGFDINHRDESLVGNIKVTWEKNRHHHLSILAAAYGLTREERFAEEVAKQILGWIQQNPYLVGVNWTHPLEQAIRLIAWVWCERLLRGSAQYARIFGKGSPVWDSVYHHQQFIASTYSRGSSANNHLIGEMAGLFVASCVWPWFDDSRQWQDLSQSILEREIFKQTFSSGINRELAFSYQLFVLEFLMLALLEANRAGREFSSPCRELMKRMLEVIPQLTDAGGNLPRFGDGDEGMAIQLQTRSARRQGWLFRAGRALLDAHVPVDPDGALVAGILGFRQVFNSEWTPKSASIEFEDAGVYVLTHKRNSDQEIFVLADAGPLGLPTLAAHGHADALSFTLSAGGKPIVVDPGTFVYHTDGYWRRYFRGTTAHNTVIIDGLDQSTQGGPFLWTHRAQSRVISWNESSCGGRLVASHDGYSKIGIRHQRSLELAENVLTVLDELEGTGTHLVRLAFHFAPECRVQLTESNFLQVSRDQEKVNILFPSLLKVRLLRGSRQGGWYSPCFGVKQESFSAFAETQCSLPCQLKTLVEVHFES